MRAEGEEVILKVERVIRLKDGTQRKIEKEIRTKIEMAAIDEFESIEER